MPNLRGGCCVSFWMLYEPGRSRDPAGSDVRTFLGFDAVELAMITGGVVLGTLAVVLI